MSVEFLPLELLQNIFSYCSTSDQLSINLVCKRWEAAVEPVLLRKTCLKVSYGVLRDDEYDHTVIIDEELLRSSQRPYACLRVEWDVEEKRCVGDTIEQLVDLCEKRFPIRRLFIRAPANKRLMHFFMRHSLWLQNLQELDIELGSSSRHSDKVVSISLPQLKTLSWFEKPHGEFLAWGDSEPTVFTFCRGFACSLHAPQLDTLRVRVSSNLLHTPSECRAKDLDVCCTFLPSFALMPYPKLQNIEIIGLFELEQCQVECTELLMQNLTVLRFTKCHSDVIELICGKCTNLKELIIDDPLEGLLSFQISPALVSLEKLTFNRICHSLTRDEPAVFPKLRVIHFIEMAIGLILGNIPLVAPQLTTFIGSLSDYANLNLLHKDQIRNMALLFDRFDQEKALPPPNVTVLSLRLPDPSSDPSDHVSPSTVKKFLELFPNLSRLTLVGDGSTVLDGTFIQCTFPSLHFFHADQLVLGLAGIIALSYIKRIIITRSVIEIKGHMREVLLPAVEYFRVDQVSVKNAAEFPIKTNEKQPPIERVCSNEQETSVFSSRNFEMQFEPEFQEIMFPTPRWSDPSLPTW